MHLSAFDQDPISLVEAEVDLTEKYDFVYIKMMTKCAAPPPLNPEPHLKTAVRNHL